LLGISKGTYYNSKYPKDRLEEKYQNIRKFVGRVIKNNPCYGIRRIKASLFEDYGIIVGRDTLGILLKLWGLSIRRKTRKRKPSTIERILKFLGSKTNLLAQTKLSRPFQVITSDISRFVYCNGKKLCYLAVHKDAFGQMVYGYQVSETMEDSIVIGSFKKCCKTIRRLTGRISKKLIFHQDQGSQYTGYRYVDNVLIVGSLSYSSLGNPTDNPGQESFFGRFKDEWKDEIYELRTFREASLFIDHKIKYYNKKRIHTSINYQNPYKFTKSFLKNVPRLDKKWFSVCRS
jgi:putative transposase